MVVPTCLHSDVETSWRTINKRVHRRRQCEKLFRILHFVWTNAMETLYVYRVERTNLTH